MASKDNAHTAIFILVLASSTYPGLCATDSGFHDGRWPGNTQKAHSHPGKRAKALTGKATCPKSQLTAVSMSLCCSPGALQGVQTSRGVGRITKHLSSITQRDQALQRKTASYFLLHSKTRPGGPCPISNFDLSGEKCRRLPEPIPPGVPMNPATCPRSLPVPSSLPVLKFYQ